MSGTIYADLRCLQDLAYQFRGIGYHTSALLRARMQSELAPWRIVGLVDPRMPKLPDTFASLVDEISWSVNPRQSNVQSIYIEGSPMTHDTLFGLRFQHQNNTLTVAVLYDFIPLDWPGYLQTVASRIEYVAKIARLKKFDLFCPISEYTARRLSELTGVRGARITVTGACVRRSLYGHRSARSAANQEPYFVTLGGDDRRKNTDVVVKAVRLLNVARRKLIPLKVIGHYSSSYKNELLRLAGHPEGAGFVEFCSNIPDEEVVELHTGAVAAIAPSYIEGFSLPVPEAALCGCPVLASTCAAQLEMVHHPEALFQPDNPGELADKLDAVLNNPSLRASIIASQSDLGARFHEDEVGRRFWEGIAAAVENRGSRTVVSESRKPKVVFLSPHPSDSCDASVYTSMLPEAGKDFFISEIFSDASRQPTAQSGVPEQTGVAGGISLAPFLNAQNDVIVSVLNSKPCDGGVPDIFERFGGGCILHAWLEKDGVPAPAVDAIIKRAAPLMVHSSAHVELVNKLYGLDAHLLPCCTSVSIAVDELKESSRDTMRNARGIDKDTFLIVALGGLSLEHGTYASILALELLRSWRIPAELYLLGDSGIGKPEAERLVDLYKLGESAHFMPRTATNSGYRNMLLMADGAVVLWPDSFGYPPISLVDCICAGLPTVATIDAAQSCEAPSFVATVNDCFSPLQVAEQLALIWENRTRRESHLDECFAYRQTHNFRSYSRKLAEVLDLL
jgi:glycosyltransferase involved in cell wall biosynthesis